MEREYLKIILPLIILAAGLLLAVVAAVIWPGRSSLTLHLPAWSFTGPSDFDQASCPTLNVSLEQYLSAKMAMPVESPFEHERQNRVSSGVAEMAENEMALSPPGIRVSMIIHNGHRAICRINGQDYRPGDSGPGFRVLRILDESVQIVTDSGELLQIYMGQEGGSARDKDAG